MKVCAYCGAELHQERTPAGAVYATVERGDVVCRFAAPPRLGHRPVEERGGFRARSTARKPVLPPPDPVVTDEIDEGDGDDRQPELAQGRPNANAGQRRRKLVKGALSMLWRHVSP